MCADEQDIALVLQKLSLGGETELLAIKTQSKVFFLILSAIFNYMICKTDIDEMSEISETSELFLLSLRILPVTVGKLLFHLSLHLLGLQASPLSASLSSNSSKGLVQPLVKGQ